MSIHHVKALKEAKSKLGKTHSFICHALPDNKYGDEILKQIMEDLDGWNTLRSWLDKQNIVGFDYFEFTNYHPKMIATRKAWINALILYWKDKP
jgi:hypothetical protein